MKRSLLLTVCILALGVSVLLAQHVRKINEFQAGEGLVELVATPEGAVFGIASDQGTALEIRNGSVEHRFEVKEAKPIRLAADSAWNKYVLFSGLSEPLVNTYDTRGSLVSSIRYPDMPPPEALAVDDEGQIVVFSAGSVDLPETDYLVYRFDSSGRVISRLMRGKVGPRRQGCLIAAGQSGEIAVFRADEGRVYWLTSDGGTIYSNSLTDHVTALGFVQGNLHVLLAKFEERESRPGAVVRALGTPKLLIVQRDGAQSVIELEDEARGVNQIHSTGKLLRVYPGKVDVFDLRP